MTTGSATAPAVTYTIPGIDLLRFDLEPVTHR